MRPPVENRPVGVAADPAGLRNCVPKLADFSLARIGRRAEVTRHGEPLGTAPYMAPELAEGNTGAMGPRTPMTTKLASEKTST